LGDAAANQVFYLQRSREPSPTVVLLLGEQNLCVQVHREQAFN